MVCFDNRKYPDTYLYVSLCEFKVLLISTCLVYTFRRHALKIKNTSAFHQSSNTFHIRPIQAYHFPLKRRPHLFKIIFKFLPNFNSNHRRRRQPLCFSLNYPIAFLLKKSCKYTQYLTNNRKITFLMHTFGRHHKKTLCEIFNV